MSENVVSITEVVIGDEWVRKTRSPVKIDPRGEDIHLYWTAEGPRGYGYTAQPYSRSPYGGTMPEDFLGWDIEVWYYHNGASTGSLIRVHRESVPARQFSFVWTEEQNVQAAARIGLGFQCLVKFIVWPVTVRGRGKQGTVTTVCGSGSGVPVGSPMSTHRKWFNRPVRFHVPNNDDGPVIIQQGVTTPSGRMVQFEDYSGSVLSYVDENGEWSSLSDIRDVDLTGLANGDGIVWNSSSGKWEPGATGGASALDDLTDVSVPSPATGDVLVKSSGGDWVNLAPDSTILKTGAAFGVDVSATFAWTGSHSYTTTPLFKAGVNLEEPGVGTSYVTLTVPSTLTAGSYTFTLPADGGTDGDVLGSGGGGTTAWVQKLSDVVDDTSPSLGGALDTNSHSIHWSKGADLTAVAALEVGTDGNYFVVNGTTTITSIAGIKTNGGPLIVLRFASSLTIQHTDTSLVLPGGNDIVTQSGDIAVFIEDSSGNWRLVHYLRDSGTPGARRFLSAYNSTSSSSVTSATGGTTKIPFDTVQAQSNDTSLFSVSGSTIVVNEDAKVRIQVDGQIHLTAMGGTVGRTRPRVRLYKDGSLITGGLTMQGYVRDTNNKAMTFGGGLIVSATSGNAFSLEIDVPYADDVGNTIQAVSKQCHFNIEEYE